MEISEKQQLKLKFREEELKRREQEKLLEK